MQYMIALVSSYFISSLLLPLPEEVLLVLTLIVCSYCFQCVEISFRCFAARVG